MKAMFSERVVLLHAFREFMGLVGPSRSSLPILSIRFKIPLRDTLLRTKSYRNRLINYDEPFYKG
jgi:hypothetical protein